MENSDENDADPQAGEEAENGIALLAGEETVSVGYISGVEGYTNDGLPSYTNRRVECTKLTADWLASKAYTLTAGWYAVRSSISLDEKQSLNIEGDVHLIVGDYGLSIYKASIHLADGSTLNVYGNNQPGWNDYLGISNIAGASTTNAFTCEGSATVHAYLIPTSLFRQTLY